MTHYEDATNAVNALNNDLTDTEQALKVSKTLVTEQAAEIDGLRRDLVTQGAALKQAQADLAACQASLPKAKTLFGANVGGYAATKGEGSQAAFDRILAGFGEIGVVRWWPNNVFTWGGNNPPPFYGDRPVAPNLGSDVQGAISGKYDSALADLVRNATRRTILTFAHEPEDDVFKNGAFTINQWQTAQMRMAKVVREAGNDLVSYGPLMMGTTYHPTRYASAAPGNKPASDWMAFDMKDIDFLGADLYQWGKSDSDADHADVQFNPFLALCTEKGKAAFVGELGARRPNPPYNPGISPAKRAQYLEEAITIIDTTTVEVYGVCYYETDRGAADKVPWNLLTLSGPQTSPEAVAVWKGVSTR